MKVKTYNLVNSVEQEELDAGLLAESFSVEAKQGKAITLPDSFSTEIRTDLIRSAVHSSRANRRQPYGHREHDGKKSPQPGMKHSVEWWGKGRGVARIMRKTGQRTGAQNPHTRGGRRAHGPKVDKDWSQKLNSKQRALTRDSAIAATADPTMVSARGHKFTEGINFPIVIDNYVESRGGSDEKYDIESLPLQYSTRKFVAIMEGIGLGEDLVRAKNGKSIRAGKGTMREEKQGLLSRFFWSYQARKGSTRRLQLTGVDVVIAKDLCAEDLAPGGDPGRLTVWTKSAIEAMR